MDQPQIKQEYAPAVEIFRNHLCRGLTQLCDSSFLQRRYNEFKNKHDPIYSELLDGMNDEALARTFVSYWMVAQTLATRTRFWLEDAVADLLIEKARREGHTDLKVYSQAMLGSGWMHRGITVADIGEEQKERVSDRRPWRVRVQRSALEAIDLLVGQQERERVRREPESVQELLWPRRAWRRWQDPQLIEKDRGDLRRVAASLKGPPESEVTLQCNLLVIEPHRLDRKPHAWALRFVNPKTISSHPTRKQERVNLLRLYAWIVQEKILREPEQICVCVAELLPRYGDFEEKDRYPDYFSSHTYWSSDQLWEFIGVPFKVVTMAVRDAGVQFREQLTRGLRGLLPQDSRREGR